MDILKTSEKPKQPELITLTQRLDQQVSINAELNYAIRRKLSGIKQFNEKSTEHESVPNKPEPQSFVEELSFLISRLQEANNLLQSNFDHLNTIV